MGPTRSGLRSSLARAVVRTGAGDMVHSTGGRASADDWSCVALPAFRGDRLLAAREAAGLTREGLTLALEMSSPIRIRLWELAYESPQPRFVPQLAAAVKVEPLHLLDVDPDDPPLAALRLAAGLTIEQMGAPGMSVMTYQRLEAGRRSVGSPDTLIAALATALGVDPKRVEAAIHRSRNHKAS